MSGIDAEALTAAIRQIGADAGAVILDFYRNPGMAVRAKADRSPVTAADEVANDLIEAALEALDPAIPVVAEESFAVDDIPVVGSRFWLVDPLDGTKEFLKGNGEFTVNIALIEDTRPVLGIVAAPALERTWWGIVGSGAWTADGGAAPRPIATRRVPDDGAVVVASRSHRDSATRDWLEGIVVKAERTAGSSLKFCLVAAGEADIYPRLGPTMEWDTAAGHAVLAAAGGSVRTLDGRDLAYRKPGFANPGFIARGRD